MNKNKVSIRLYGIFSITSSDGLDLTPRSNKTKALCALLATAKDYTRSRRQLETTLWSDRAPQQASASLRQALRELKKALGPHDHVLTADRTKVCFEPEYLNAITLDQSQQPSDAIFLEGVDVKDHKFQEWLAFMNANRPGSSVSDKIDSDKNAGLAAAIIAKPSYRLVVNLVSQGEESEILADRIVGSVANMIEDMSDFEIGMVYHDVNTQYLDASLVLRVCTAKTRDRFIVSSSCIDPQSQRHIFSKNLDLEYFDGSITYNPELKNYIFLLSDLVVSVYDEQRTKKMFSSGLIKDYKSEILNFNIKNYDKINAFIDNTISLNPHSTLLSWQALLKLTWAIEDIENDTSKLENEAFQHSADALKLDPKSSFSLSIHSLVQGMLRNNVLTAKDLASYALEIEPNSAFAHLALSSVYSRIGDTRTAFHMSNSALDIARGSRFKSWFLLYHALASVSHHQLDPAISAARMASSLSPNFRAPLRILLGLHRYLKDDELAHQAAKRLKALEPQFTLERFFDDTSYPNDTLRRSKFFK